MKDRKPNWDKWNLYPSAKVWQVVALSLDIDPDQVIKSGQDWMAGGSFVNHEGNAFKDRLDIIQANYTLIDPTPASISLNGIAYSSLNIPKFAKWAFKVNIPIPDQLKKRAESPIVSKQIDLKPLHPRTENNYLRLILELALTGIDGFDPKNPFAAATLILEKTDIKLSQSTLAEYITKANKLKIDDTD